MTIAYQNLKELVDNNGIEDAISKGWDFNSDKAIAASKFYAQWGNYLSPISAVFAMMMALPGWLAKMFYMITLALEHVFNNTFKLFGIFDYLSQDSQTIGQIYNGLQIFGVALFIALLIARIVIGFMTIQVRFKDTINHLLLVTCVTSFLPQTIKVIGGLVASDSIKIINSSSDKDKGSLSMSPFESNVVDLYVIMENNFDVTTLGYQESDGYLNKAKSTLENHKLNKLTDGNILQTDFSAWYGAPDEDMMKELMKKGESDNKFKGVARLLTSKVTSNEKDAVRISHIKKGGWPAGAIEDVMAPVYMRYKVNWIALYAQQIVLMILLFNMIIKLVSSIFRIVVTGMIAPIVGYASVSSSEKFKELLMTLMNMFAGIMFEVILLRVALQVLRDLPTIALTGVNGISGNFFDGLNYWEGILASFATYAGVYYAVSGGNASIERWLGLSAGKGEAPSFSSMSRSVGMAGRNISAAGKSTGKAAAAVGRGVGSAGRYMKDGGFEKIGRGIAKGSKAAASGTKAAGRGLVKGFGNARGTYDAMRDASQINGKGKATGNYLKTSAKNGAAAVGKKANSAWNSGREKVSGGINAAKQKLSDTSASVNSTFSESRSNRYQSVHSKASGVEREVSSNNDDSPTSRRPSGNDDPRNL